MNSTNQRFGEDWLSALIGLLVFVLALGMIAVLLFVLLWISNTFFPVVR